MTDTYNVAPLCRRRFHQSAPKSSDFILSLAHTIAVGSLSGTYTSSFQSPESPGSADCRPLTLCLIGRYTQLIFDFGRRSISFHPSTMDLENGPSFPPPMYTSAKQTEKPPSYAAAPELESQQTPWTTPTPPTHTPRWPGQSQTMVVTVKHTQRPIRSTKRPRKGVVYCMLLGFIVFAIFIVMTIVEVIARVKAEVNNR